MVTKNQRIAGSRKSVCEASSYQTQNTGGSLPTRGAWIEMEFGEGPEEQVQSLPTRGAWIEISLRAEK